MQHIMREDLSSKLYFLYFSYRRANTWSYNYHNTSKTSKQLRILCLNGKQNVRKQTGKLANVKLIKRTMHSIQK